MGIMRILCCFASFILFLSSFTIQVPVVMCPEDGCFPGLYCSKLLSEPWLSDGHTMVVSSIWGSVQTILSVNVLR